MSFNWRSGNLDVTLTDYKDVSYTFLTVQNIDFRFDENIEIMDSLSQQRLGYFYAPRRIRITIGVLPSQYLDTSASTATDISDSGKLASLQAELIGGEYYYGMFILTVNDDHSGHVYTFTDCIVMEGAPSNVVMDRIPVTQWTILALEAEMTAGSVTTSYLTQGQTDIFDDVLVRDEE